MNAAFRWERHYLGLGVIIAMVCTPLYFFKKQHGQLFHPVLSRPYVTTKDTCLNKYKIEEKDGTTGFQVRLAEPFRGKECKGPTSEAFATQFIPRGSIFSVDGVIVKNISFEELYVIKTNLPFGLLEVRPEDFALVAWGGGRNISQDDLRRALFYLPARLMWWPKAPMFLYERWRARQT